MCVTYMRVVQLVPLLKTVPVGDYGVEAAETPNHCPHLWTKAFTWVVVKWTTFPAPLGREGPPRAEEAALHGPFEGCQRLVNRLCTLLITATSQAVC